jgi:catechol 2,3-dioxygenase-like lactoylglutathione lyase family enzyme
VFDHVTIRVSDLEAGWRFYDLAMRTLGFGESATDEVFHEWEDFSISQAREGKPLTRNLHAAFVAQSREAVDRWWETMTGAGYREDGEPGPRPQYSAGYYGGFVLDPDGNSVEAVYQGRPRRGEDRIDHLWIRVRDIEASQRFYEAVGLFGGFDLGGDWPQARHFRSVDRDRHFSVVHDDRPVTENVHLAFPAADNSIVDEFHRALVAAGYRDNGGPGERDYHPGYYGAFVLDPDDNNVEVVCHNR